MAMDARSFLTAAGDVFGKVSATADSWRRLHEKGRGFAVIGSPARVYRREFVEQLLPVVPIANQAIADAPAEPHEVQAVAAALQTLVDRLRKIWDEHEAKHDEFVLLESWPELTTVAFNGGEALTPLRRWLNDPARAFDTSALPTRAAQAAAVLEGIRPALDKLVDRHFERPASIGDWEHLARIVGIPAEALDGTTPREIHAQAIAWADREKIKAKLAADAASDKTPKVSHPQSAPATHSELVAPADDSATSTAKLAGLPDDTTALLSMADLALLPEIAAKNDNARRQWFARFRKNHPLEFEQFENAPANQSPFLYRRSAVQSALAAGE